MVWQTKSSQQKKGCVRMPMVFFACIVSRNPNDFQSLTVTRKLFHATITFKVSGINPAMAPIVQTPVRVPFFNTSAPPADSTCRNCVLAQPPDQNSANKPTAFTVAGERCCCQTNWWKDKAGRHRFYTLFCICTAARAEWAMQRIHGQFGEFQNAHVQTAPAELCKWTGIMFPLFQLIIWELKETWTVLPWWLPVSQDHSSG